LVDVLQADPLGLNGVVLAGITYVAWRFYERLQMYSVAQQGAVAFLLVLGAEVFRSLVLNGVAGRPWNWAAMVPAFTSFLVWPFLAVLLTRLRVRYRVL
ncbi:MAG: rod shape-determining protein MreD, partial [Pseudomonadota bacterium]